jgi:hypothetical protein
MTGWRIALPLVLALAMAGAGWAVVPGALEAGSLIAAEDDPVALADRAVARAFDATVAAREINAALAAGDADLAQSFLELARDRHVALDPGLVQEVEAANAGTATALRSLGSFTRGLVTGEPEDMSGLAGTAVGDLFVFGDVRDAVREGARLTGGGEPDHLILGLAGVGLAVTAVTYATVGAGAPARVGLTVVKAARKTGRIGSNMTRWISRSLSEVVDWGALARAARGVRVTEPAAAARAARQAVKLERGQGLLRFLGDVGHIRRSAGTRAAMDGLKLAEHPRDMARLSVLAGAKGGKTRAILKLAGRGAIVLTANVFSLAMWMFWAIFSLLGFVSSLKRMVERATERSCARRRRRRARRAREIRSGQERAPGILEARA